MKIRQHETFCIRKGWLHKGVKNIEKNNRLFNSKDINPCDLLGIGTNMVKSLRYWLNATRIMEEVNEGSLKIQRLTPFGELINKYDKFYEEEGTNYLVHYMLVTNEDWATAWYWFFNIFSASRFDKELFTSEFLDYLSTKYEYKGSRKMVEDEFDCLIRTYYSKLKEENPEETNECPLSELNLIELVDTKKKEYRKCTPFKDAIHPMIAYAIICDQKKSNEILISELVNSDKNIYKVFNLDKTTLFYILEKLQKRGLISISRTAGLDVIIIKKDMSFEKCIVKYYEDINGLTE